MKRTISSILLILVLAVIAGAQVSTQNSRRSPTGHGDPSGACVTGPPFGSDYTNVDTTPPTVWKCKAGSWSKVTSGGAPVGGTGTANQVTKFSAAQTIADSGITDTGPTNAQRSSGFFMPPEK